MHHARSMAHRHNLRRMGHRSCLSAGQTPISLDFGHAGEPTFVRTPELDRAPAAPAASTPQNMSPERPMVRWLAPSHRLNCGSSTKLSATCPPLISAMSGLTVFVYSTAICGLNLSRADRQSSPGPLQHAVSQSFPLSASSSDSGVRAEIRRSKRSLPHSATSDESASGSWWACPSQTRAWRIWQQPRDRTWKCAAQSATSRHPKA